jgi:uncharacterized protein (DUF2236 family)
MYPPPVRDRLGFRWTARDQQAFRLVGRAIGTSWRLVPHDRRFHPRARDAWRRARGQVAPDAPLIQTPARNLPPARERGKPTHYCPTA